jgi:hypothetical protein
MTLTQRFWQPIVFCLIISKILSLKKNTFVLDIKLIFASFFSMFHIRALYHTKTPPTNSAWTLRCPARTTESSRLQKQRSTQSTAHSHSTVKYNPSVTVTESSPWRWPSRVETCRSVLRLMIKLSLRIYWWLVFSVWYSARTWNTLNPSPICIFIFDDFAAFSLSHQYIILTNYFSKHPQISCFSKLRQ